MQSKVAHKRGLRKIDAMNVLRFVGATAVTLIIAAILFLFGQEVGIRSVLFAFFSNFFLMLWVHWLFRLVKPSLTSPYFEPKSFERGGWSYRSLGVVAFGKILKALKWDKTGRRAQFDGSPASIVMLENETRSAEAGHGIIFLLMLGLALYVLARGWWDAAGWLTLFNFIFNAYPVMLQRYNRIRLVRIMQRMNRRSKGAI